MPDPRGPADPVSASVPFVPERPPPPRPPLTRLFGALRAWVDWIGPGRIVATGLAFAALVVGVVWLVSVPAPPDGSVGGPAIGSVHDGSPPARPTGADPSEPPAFTLVAPPPVVSDEPLVVHVAGAVRSPGVYEVGPDARVTAAIEAAGGSLPGAVVDALNLAAPLVDGQRVYVPAAGEVVPQVEPVGSGSGSGGGGPPVPIDVNTAAPDELLGLPGVGPATAAAIVDERERNGPFEVVDDLIRVRGIGPAKLDAVRDLVRAS